MTVKAIIPCAGYGTRMQMQPNESKEMLTDPVTGKTLIDYSLDLCYKYNIRPILIVRSGKEDLLKYLLTSKDYGKFDLIVSEPGKEWAETVLKSQGLWGDKNILILPDTRWTDDNNAFERIVKTIQYPQQELVIGYHVIAPENSVKWGAVVGSSIMEKVHSDYAVRAWGILGFDSSIGRDLFQCLKPGGVYTNKNSYGILLKDFKDITRSGQLEKY